ncbi:VWA domain-containing protein [Bacteroidales bacterium OttesenSCG-928-C19]|nr:VWA domain-containing protein [Bacteroidales bacterium OttesenSCG-928-C19]
MKKILFILLFLSAFSTSFAQRKSVVELSDKTRILFILDCSNSMWDKWQSDAKIKVTQTVLTKLLDSLERQKDVEVGLRVFGHLNKDAFGTRLEVPFNENNYEMMRSKIKTLVPKGGYTAAEALSKSLNDFPHNEYSRNLIFIITDGVDDSEGMVCNVAKNIEETGVIVQTFVVAIGKDVKEGWACAGEFYNVSNEEKFTSTLYELIHYSANRSKVVVNLLDVYNNPTVTNIPISFHDERTGKPKYYFMHTMNVKSQPDTFLVDPLLTYTMIIHSMPRIEIPKVKAFIDSTITLSAKVNNGSLRVTWAGKKKTIQQGNAEYVIRKAGESDILCPQSMEMAQNLLEGEYDLEIFTTPVTHLKNVQIKANAETNISLPYPGKVNIIKTKQMMGSVFSENDGETWLIGNLDPMKDVESMVLMPGNYTVVVRPQGSKKVKDTIRREFKVESGLSTNVNISK